MALWIFLIISIFSLFLLWIKFKQNYWLRRGIPHSSPTFFLGNISKTHWSDAFVDVYKKFKGSGPFAGYYLFLGKTALIMDMDLLKNILIKDFNNFVDRGLYHNIIDDPLTGNLFFLDDEKWRRLRHKMTPTFTSGKMKFMFSTVLKVGEELENVMLERVSDEGEVYEIINLLSRFTADVIGLCAFGLDCNSLRDPESEFVKMGKKFSAEPRHSKIVEGIMYCFPNLARRFHMRFINQSVHDFYMDIVKKTIEYRESSGIRRNDFMDLLMDLRKSKKDDNGEEIGGLTVEEVAAQAFVFFLAGFETSSTTMGFALHELTQNQDIQDKVRSEIRETFRKHNNKLTHESMQEMEYLNQIINETLRMHPVLPFLIRQTRNHYETGIPHYHIEAGTIILIPVLGIHYDQEYYPGPEKFKPERFTDDETSRRPTCAYLPFGEGPRNCIGSRFGKMQTCIGLAYLLKHFKFSVTPETEIPIKLMQRSVFLTPENGIRLKLERV